MGANMTTARIGSMTDRGEARETPRQEGTSLNSDSPSFLAHVANPALDKLLELLAEGFKVDSVQTDWAAGGKIITVYLRKGSLEATVKSGDRDFCDYASALYSSP